MPVFGSATKSITVNTSADTIWYNRIFPVDGSTAHPSLIGFFHRSQYGEIYRKQPVVRRVVDKYIKEITKLPLKTYERVPDGFGGEGREDARESLYGELITSPHPFLNRVAWLSWLVMTYFVYGETFLYKMRDGRDGLNSRGGLPVQLLPIHPTKVRYGPPGGGFDLAHRDTDADLDDDGDNRWWIEDDNGREVEIPRRDLVHWARPNPHSLRRGLSQLETLRQTLEDEAAMRQARHSHWKHGGHPSFVLEYEGEWIEGSHAAERLANQFSDAHGGPFQAGKPLILEDGVKAKEMPAQADLDYIGSRKMNELEVVAAFDMPLPAVGIHDASTYSNVEELMASLTRDTIAPELNALEAAFDFDLRDGRFGDEGEPDFGDSYYAEFEMSGVARGTFADRIAANARMIQTAQATINEVRRRENLPPVEGGDTLFINGAVIPVHAAANPEQPTGAGQGPLPPGAGISIEGDGGDTPVNVENGGVRAIGTDGDSADLARLEVQGLESGALSTVMGRLSRPKTLAEVDIQQVTDGIDRPAADAVKACYLLLSDHMDGTVANLREAIKRLRI